MGVHLFRSFNSKKEEKPTPKPKADEPKPKADEPKPVPKMKDGGEIPVAKKDEKKARPFGVVGGPFTDYEKAKACKDANPGSIIKEKEGFKKKNGQATTEKIKRYTVVMK